MVSQRFDFLIDWSLMIFRTKTKPGNHVDEPNERS